MQDHPRGEEAGLGSVLLDEKTGCHAKLPQVQCEQQGQSWGPTLPCSLTHPSIPGTAPGTSHFPVCMGERCDGEGIQRNSEVSNSNNQPRWAVLCPLKNYRLKS